jgi:hypothetical protein
MTLETYKERRSITEAVRHGRLGSACAAAMVAGALAASICAIALALGTEAVLASHSFAMTLATV